MQLLIIVGFLQNIKVTAEIEEAFVGVLTMTCVSSDVPVAFEDRELEELVSLTAGSARTTSLWIVKVLNSLPMQQHPCTDNESIDVAELRQG